MREQGQREAQSQRLKNEIDANLGTEGQLSAAHSLLARSRHQYCRFLNPSASAPRKGVRLASWLPSVAETKNPCCSQLGGETGGQILGADEDVYYVNVEIGTPPQPFRVKLDTGEPSAQ